MTDSINQLITLCTQQAPGQKECDNALRELEVNWPDQLVICGYFAFASNTGVPALSLSLSSLQAVRGMLDNPNEPVSDLSYFDCIESVMENSKVGPSGEHARDQVWRRFSPRASALLPAGPGRIHGRDLHELQEQRRGCVRRLCGICFQSLVWPH